MISDAVQGEHVQDWGYEGFGEDELGTGDPKCPVVLLLDTSQSMGRDRTDDQGRSLRPGIDELNEGLRAFSKALLGDTVAPRRVDVQVITFGGSVELHGRFTPASAWKPPTLRPAGRTPMREAIERGLDLADQRRRELQSTGAMVYCPWIFLLTDGEPSTSVEGLGDRILQAENTKRAIFWAIGAQGADVGVLRSLSKKRPVLQFDERDWKSLFVWMSAAVSSTVAARPGEQASIDPWTITA